MEEAKDRLVTNDVTAIIIHWAIIGEGSGNNICFGEENKYNNALFGMGMKFVCYWYQMMVLPFNLVVIYLEM